MKMAILKVAIYVLIVLLMLAAAFLGYFTLTDYRPGQQETLAEKSRPDVIDRDTVSFMTWNIGYGGLDAGMSFFYDGGSRVRPSAQQAKDNLDYIKRRLASEQETDIFLLQEVDVDAKRSYHTNQFRRLHEPLSAFHGYFALNYHVQFIPVPLRSPLGKVSSGLATYSAWLPGRVARWDYPGGYTWPKRLFMLERCFMVLRYPLQGGGQLVVINTHNSAYDQGKLKQQEMAFLKDFMIGEYEKGRHVIAGGDWNQYPPDIASRSNRPDDLDQTATSTIPADFMPDHWQWVYDPTVPTNRSLEAPYADSTSTALIDFFLVSPNVQPIEVKTRQLNFQNTDHHPVYGRFRLK